MDQVSTVSLKLPLLVLAALSATGAVAFAFYGWAQYGSGMLLTLSETGLALCL